MDCYYPCNHGPPWEPFKPQDYCEYVIYNVTITAVIDNRLSNRQKNMDPNTLDDSCDELELDLEVLPFEMSLLETKLVSTRCSTSSAPLAVARALILSDATNINNATRYATTGNVISHPTKCEKRSFADSGFEMESHRIE